MSHMILQDFHIAAKKGLPEHPFDLSKVVFHVNYWNGPTEGLYRLKDREYWFWCVDESGKKKRRRVFVLIELSKDQITEEKLWHKLFKLLVKDGKRLKPQNEWDRFYKPFRARPSTYIPLKSIVGKLVEK